MRLGVTVCTRNRPRLVQACIAALCREIVNVEADVFIVVVENHNHKTLTAAFDRLLDDHPKVDLVYRVEPMIGIPFARNRAVDVALEHQADWIAFVDDDEEVEPGWLAAMIRAIRELNADALTGPVRDFSPTGLPSWWSGNRVDNRRHGQTLESAATNNTLLWCGWLRSADPPLRFNEALRFTGGEDTEFFHRLSDRGGTIKWVSDAFVRETVSDVRMTMSWHVTRKVRSQANATLNFRQRKGIVATLCRFLPTLLGRAIIALPILAIGLSCRPFSKRLSDRIVFRGLKCAAAAFGALRGLLGWQLQPYRDVRECRAAAGRDAARERIPA